MATLAQGVLYEYKTRVLFWLIPLFFVIGCMLLALAVGLPLLIRPAPDTGLYVSIAIAGLGGVGMPIVAVALWLLIPEITTTYDAARRVLVLHYRRPIGQWVKEFRADEIADISLMSMGEGAYSLALRLKSGKNVRLEYGASSDTAPKRAAAQRIKAVMGLGGAARELRV
jgi:hypothetical protein